MLRREAEGWAPLYRRIFQSSIWAGQTATTKVVAVWIIGHVRHTSSSETPAGSVDATLDEIGRECGQTRNTTRTALSSLRDAKFIAITRSRDGLRISVLEWQRWLSVEIESSQRSSRKPRSDAPASLNLPLDVQPLTPKGATVAPLSSKEEDQEGSDAAHQLIAPATQRLTGYRETIDAFHQRYVDAYGSKPTWRSAEGANLKRLLAAHGADEVQRRIAILFDHPPRWLTPPFSFMTLVSNFDRLVVAGVAGPGGKRGGMTPAEILQHAARRRQ